MKLYFSGHDCRYAAEQTLLMLFPGEKPEYPEGPPSGDRCELTVKRGGRYTVCSALLVRGGVGYRGRAQVENSRLTGEFETVGYTNRIVKLAFYRAALASGLPKPEWGSLSGVRPAKLMDGYLREGLSPRAAKSRFKREYFVSEERAQLCLDSALAAQKAERSLEARDVCLYVGIPFCPTRCAYCSFVSQSVEKSMKLIEPFMDTLMLDIEATAAEVRRAGLRPVSIYMGGGTPTTLSAAQLERLCAKLEREFDLDLVTTLPSVIYEVIKTDGTMVRVDNPHNYPDPASIAEAREPYVNVTIITPQEFVGNIMPLCQDRRGEYKNMQYLDARLVELHYVMPLNEIIYDFFDTLKARTKGYASLDYELADYKPSELVKVDMLLNGEQVDALSFIAHKDKAYPRARKLCEKLKENIPRQLFEVPVQAAIGGKIIARETVKALRKDVLAKCYGGDITRKKKLLEKQKEGKKKMRQLGTVQIPTEAFLAVLKLDE